MIDTTTDNSKYIIYLELNLCYFTSAIAVQLVTQQWDEQVFFLTVLPALQNLVESFSFARQMWRSIHNQDMI